MSYTVESYQKRCEEAATHFLQSVVVIDNEAELYSGELSGIQNPDRTNQKSRTLIAKPASGLSSGHTHPAIKPQKADKEQTVVKDQDGKASKSHKLSAWVLTEKLADKGILCTVYRPNDHSSQEEQTAEEADKLIVNRSVNMARLADIVVLDWELGGVSKSDKGTRKARDIIIDILNNDDRIKGRQRLIAVYTGTPDINAAFTDVLDDIGSTEYAAGKLDSSKKDLSLSNRTIRIVFLNKYSDALKKNTKTTVSEEDLPERLVKEFVIFNRGLLPSIALHSIAAIRETTHHLLSTFGSHLDPALVSHRSLLPEPEDSEEFVLDLVSGEFRSALSVNRIGQLFAGSEAHHHWIAGQLGKQDSFKLKKDISVTRQEARELISEGSSAFDKICRSIIHRWADEMATKKVEIQHKTIPGKISKKTIRKLVESLSVKDLRKHIDAPLMDFKQLTGLFAESQKKGGEIDCEFSRLTTLKRECYGRRNLPRGWLPKLTQGSIIRKIEADGSLSNKFLLCIQPRCDSVRITEKMPFPFLVMTTKKVPASTKQFLVIRCKKDIIGEFINIKLWLRPFPFQQEMLIFDPTASTGNHIAAVRENNNWIFECGGTRYEWIADMKDFLAQKICDQLSGRQGSIGLDEYEWLRRFSNS